MSDQELKPCQVNGEGWCEEHDGKARMEEYFYCAKTLDASEKIAALESEVQKWRDREAGMSKNHLDEMERSAQLEAERDALAALIFRAKSHIRDLLDPVASDSPKSHWDFLRELDKNASVERARLVAEVVEAVTAMDKELVDFYSWEKDPQLGTKFRAFKDAHACLAAHDAGTKGAKK